ncbi:hypothetical protein RRG08_026406 [Elysia crispata]|uniref:Uncharacterized protein n=1 Tax=Elysia crispata TaxID=231223 RepID=A0AAE1CJJ0_9GAST|nr:hypothetical protein RRG08_026406 [Elysia crispata]
MCVADGNKCQATSNLCIVRQNCFKCNKVRFCFVAVPVSNIGKACIGRCETCQVGSEVATLRSARTLEIDARQRETGPAFHFYRGRFRYDDA